MPPKNNANNSVNKNVKVKVSADVKDAMKDLSELERKAAKIADLANQGENRQGGLLSPKQVQMFKDIAKEMESVYDRQYQSYTKMGKKYSDEMSKIMKDIKKHQDNLNSAQGGNKWGDVSSPAIVDYHQRKLAESQKAHDDLRGGPGGAADITRMETALRLMRSEIEGNRVSVDRINQMHEMSPKTRHLLQGGVNTALSAGAVTSVSSLFNYMGKGKDMIRDAEAATRVLAQKGMYGGSDETNIRDIEQKGLEKGYNVQDTLGLQASLVSSGSTDRGKALEDVGTAQTFGRAYGTDPTNLSDSFGILKKLGTLEEGQLKKLADLIGGAVRANGMNGREEEMMRATTMLIASVSDGMTQLSETGLGNIAALQASLGDAIPSLRGESGAALLGGIDTAIKAQDPNGDILLGKGSKFTGIQGYYDLEMQKAEGLSNPENLKTLLSNIQNNFVGSDYQQVVLRDWVNNRGGNMSLPQAKEFMESGLWKSVSQGETQLSQEQLEQFGLAEQQERTKEYAESETATRQTNEAQQNIRQRYVADEYEATGSYIMDKFNSLPDWMQKGTMIGAGVGGTLLAPKIARSLGKTVFKSWKGITPNIGGTSPVANWFKNLRGNTPAPVPTPANPVPQILGPNGQPISSTPTPTPPSNPASKLESLKSVGKGIGKVAGKVLGPIGAAGMVEEGNDLGGALGDWIFGHEKGQPYKEVGLFANPFAPQKYHQDSRPGIGKRLMNFFSGNEGTEEEQREARERQVRVAKSMVPESTLKKLEEKYGKISIDPPEEPKMSQPILSPSDKASVVPAVGQAGLLASGNDPNKMFDKLSRPWERMWDRAIEDFSRKVEEAKPSIVQEQVIKIQVSGKVEGLTPQGESQFLGSVKDFFSTSNLTDALGLNLGVDQTRK